MRKRFTWVIVNDKPDSFLLTMPLIFVKTCSLVSALLVRLRLDLVITYQRYLQSLNKNCRTFLLQAGLSWKHRLMARLLIVR